MSKVGQTEDRGFLQLLKRDYQRILSKGLNGLIVSII
jgi:hypothetical protein